ncbi:MAG: hypothetical protein QM813_02595 [Verrucomicrobiota bacterium]
MEKGNKLSKVFLYQNLGFLTVIALGFLDEMTRLSSLVFGDAARAWEFRRSTLAMLLVLSVWFLVSMSTRRILDRLRYSRKFHPRLRLVSSHQFQERVDHHGAIPPARF